jgi:hypothetical protein
MLPVQLAADRHQDGWFADACRGVDGTSRTEIGGPPRL